MSNMIKMKKMKSHLKVKVEDNKFLCPSNLVFSQRRKKSKKLKKKCSKFIMKSNTITNWSHALLKSMKAGQTTS